MTDVPVQIGVYRIEREIGRGGMGVVYLARDQELDRKVAIKALPAGLAERGDRLARLEREARSLAHLNHPNVGGIHAVVEHDGRRFLVLEYVEGDTLADRLGSGPLATDEALELAIGIAAGVAAAHKAGVVHRDLKPENIKVTHEGQVKVLDFGLAKILEPTADAGGDDAPTVATSPVSTMPGAILGTASYMSPEQARGRPVDRRSDIWSFGVILYEMLTGVNPFRGESVGDSISAVLHEEVDLDRLPPEESGTLRRIIRRTLQRDPDRRLHDADDARIELEELVSCEVVPASGPVPSPVVHRAFRITDDVCKSLDRDGLDPLLPGWDLQYSDNCRNSPVLIMWIPSWGGDQTSPPYRHLMDACRHRVITPTPVGMEPHALHRPDISSENQLVLLRTLAAALRESLRPRHLVIAGSSCGSVMALRCVAGDESGKLFDGLLAIDPDVAESDCFVTNLFANLDPDSPHETVDVMKRISGSCKTLFEWISMHEHMLQCVDKMQDDLTPLVRQGRAFAEHYRNVRQARDSPFVPWLREACQRARVVRAVFPDNPEKHRLVGEMRIMHLDSQCLGPCFTDDTIAFASAATHLEMLRTERMLECIDDLVDVL